MTRTAVGMWRRLSYALAGVMLAWATFATLPLAAATPGAQAAAPPGTFTITGDPESAEGAAWRFQGKVDGVRYDLTGVLLKPKGDGPFPAVVLSHGAQGSAAMIARMVGQTMRGWSMVVIAVNYTHASGVPMGSPGDARDRGASRANVERAHMAHDLLARLGYVDMTRVALHGHSMGAYLEAAAASRYPSDFRVASTTGGGVRPDRFFAGAAPGASDVAHIRIPFQLHHGDSDETVPLEYDQRFAALLQERNVPHELYVYPGGHLAPRADPLMFERVRAWYARFGMF
ncbi:MAG: alpha/beta hydrolase family protein [Vicinamibacterales bacterium]